MSEIRKLYGEMDDCNVARLDHIKRLQYITPEGYPLDVNLAENEAIWVRATEGGTLKIYQLPKPK